MLVEQLKADYRQIYRVLYAEGQMRNRVFPLGHAQRGAKIGEINVALQALQRIKELLKAHLEINVEPDQQLALLDGYTTSGPAERKEYL